MAKLSTVIRDEWHALFELKKTERLWHIPLLASICTGIPLLLGHLGGHLDYGALACIGGLVILYLPSTNLVHRMLTLLLCAFGFIISFTVGAALSFDPILSAATLGLFAFGVNWTVKYFSLLPPRNFFFIMIASMASCMPFDLVTLPTKIGLIALGAIFACIMALFYSIYIVRHIPVKEAPVILRKVDRFSLIESGIIGFFIAVSLLIGHLFRLDNPYWIPISCLAIMQGLNVVHVRRRGFHRILGTFIGIGFTWLLLMLKPSPLLICIMILTLQFVIEMLVVRHYALAVIFITPLTFFLAEIASGFSANSTQLTSSRLIDIIIGSLIGVFGGWLLYNRKLQRATVWQLYQRRKQYFKSANR